MGLHPFDTVMILSSIDTRVNAAAISSRSETSELMFDTELTLDAFECGHFEVSCLAFSEPAPQHLARLKTARGRCLSTKEETECPNGVPSRAYSSSTMKR